MQIFSKIINSFLTPFYSKPGVYTIGPNNFAELIKQFDNPPKEKTQEDIVRDYTIKETMSKLELEMLYLEPTSFYKGFQTWYDNEGNKFFDWVYCSVRPEVIYCSYGKN